MPMTADEGDLASAVAAMRPMASAKDFCNALVVPFVD